MRVHNSTKVQHIVPETHWSSEMCIRKSVKQTAGACDQRSTSDELLEKLRSLCSQTHVPTVCGRGRREELSRR